MFHTVHNISLSTRLEPDPGLIPADSLRSLETWKTFFDSADTSFWANIERAITMYPNICDTQTQTQIQNTTEQEEELIQPGHLASAEREIERFERKFILPLQSSLVIIIYIYHHRYHVHFHFVSFGKNRLQFKLFPSSTTHPSP